MIENRTGAGGTTGSASVAKADPDGYTILLLTSSQASGIVLHKSLPYDPVNDFVPVAMFGIQPSVLVVSPSKGWKTVAELIAAAKANPGTLNFASAGVGSASHWAAERLRLAAGITAQHIPFRGAEGLNELIAGRIDFYFVPLAPAVPHIQNGRVLPLAVSTPKRAPSLAGGADHRRGRLSQCAIYFLGRPGAAGKDAARHCRQIARRNPEGAEGAGGAGAAGDARRRADADERG